MGTACALHLYAPRRAEAYRAACPAIEEVVRIERRYSRYRSGNLMAAINQAAQRGESIEVDEETAGLLDYAYACHAGSGGLFDITAGLLRQAWDFTSGKLPSQAAIAALLPRIGLDKVIWKAPRLTFTVPGMELDFGGLGKEYAADQAAEICRAHGIRHGLVDLGGDLAVIGPHPDGTPWRIGIRHPRQNTALMDHIEIHQGGLASSGDYERCITINGKRYGHILDPRSGWPVEGLASVSVIADKCMVAGSLSTIAMLKGRDGIGWLESLGVAHLWMDETGHQGGSPRKRM